MKKIIIYALKIWAVLIIIPSTVMTLIYADRDSRLQRHVIDFRPSVKEYMLLYFYFSVVFSILTMVIFIFIAYKFYKKPWTAGVKRHCVAAVSVCLTTITVSAIYIIGLVDGYTIPLYLTIVVACIYLLKFPHVETGNETHLSDINNKAND